MFCCIGNQYNCKRSHLMVGVKSRKFSLLPLETEGIEMVMVAMMITKAVVMVVMMIVMVL